MFNFFLKKQTQAIWGLGVFLMFIAIDQLTKNSATNIFKNHFFAFSLPVPVYIMYSVYFFGILAIAINLVKNFWTMPKLELFAWVFVMSGAVSNVTERVVLGFVRDWIHILNGVFNLADGYIVVGVIILLLIPKSPTLNSKQILISKSEN